MPTWSLICLLLAGTICAAYWPTFRNGFVNYDDNGYVTENAHVLHGLTWQDTTWAFTTGHTGYAHPVTWLTHQFDYQLYGPWAGGHHLTSLLIHVLNSLLLFMFFLRATRALWSSAFVAALFAVHPLHVESVAWVAERKDVLSGLFFMLTLHAYAFYARKTQWWSYGLALGFFAVGLLAKPMLVTIPFLLLLLDYWPLKRLPSHQNVPAATGRGRFLGRPILEKIPFATLAAIWGVLTFVLQRTAGVVVENANIGIGFRIENAIVSYVIYLRQTLWPIKLAVFYPYPRVLPWETVALTALLLTIISVLCFATRRRFPYLIAGWCWFVGMLVPVIGLIQAGSQAHADRYTYLPQIGLGCAVSWGIADLFARWHVKRYALPIAAAIVISSLVILTRKQVTVWHDSESLWNHALAVTSENDTAHNQLCDALLRRGQVDNAIAQAKMAIAIRPDGANGHSNLAIALSRKGEPEAALGQFERVLKSKPNRPKLHYNIATVLLGQGQLDEAISHFQKELEIQPDFADAHNNLGVALLKKGKLDEAMSHLKTAAELDPGRPTVNYNMGTVCLRQRNTDQAITYFQRELQIQPNDSQTLNDLGIALSQKGELKDALVQWEKALTLQPDNLNANCNLAWVLATSADSSIRNGPEAISLAQRALKLSGEKEPRVFRLLAAAYAEDGRFGEAIEMAERGRQLAEAQGDSALVSLLRSNLDLYELKTPLRDLAQPR